MRYRCGGVAMSLGVGVGGSARAGDCGARWDLGRVRGLFSAGIKGAVTFSVEGE